MTYSYIARYYDSAGGILVDIYANAVYFLTLTAAGYHLSLPAAVETEVVVQPQVISNHLLIIVYITVENWLNESLPTAVMSPGLF